MTTETAPIEGGDNKHEASPHEEKAKTAGWKPKEEYDGDPEAWVDAEEFNKRAPLYKKNHGLKREIADLKATVHEMKGHMSKVSEAAYNKAVADLEARRDQAIDEGDRDQVKEIDKAIKDAENLKPADPGIHPVIAAWEKENGEWFYADKSVSRFGMTFAQNYLAENTNDMEGAMEAMEEAVKKAFPDKCGKKQPDPPKRPAAPAVEGGGTQGKPRAATKADLNDEQRRVMSRFVRSGVMTEADYIKDLAESGLIGGKK